MEQPPFHLLPHKYTGHIAGIVAGWFAGLITCHLSVRIVKKVTCASPFPI